MTQNLGIHIHLVQAERIDRQSRQTERINRQEYRQTELSRLTAVGKINQAKQINKQTIKQQ